MEKETKICERESCSKPFKVKAFSLKKYCSSKCRTIKWAVREDARGKNENAK